MIQTRRDVLSMEAATVAAVATPASVLALVPEEIMEVSLVGQTVRAGQWLVIVDGDGRVRYICCG